MVRPILGVPADEIGEGVWQGHRFAAEADCQAAGGRSEVVGSQCGDFHQRMGEQAQQDAGDSVGKRFAGAGEQFSDPLQPFVLGDCRAVPGGSGLDDDGPVQVRFTGDDEEGADQVRVVGPSER